MRCIVAGAVFIMAMCAGCGDKVLPPGEAFVRSKVVGELRDVSYHDKGNVVCGRIVDPTSGKQRQFIADVGRHQLLQDNTEGFVFREYAKRCELRLTDAQLAELDAGQQPHPEATGEARARQAARERYNDWSERNADAIGALHEAARARENH